MSLHVTFSNRVETFRNIEAAKLVEKRDGGKAAEYYESAAKLYIEVGQHARAAKQLEKAAALYELKLGKKLKAMKCYEKG